MHRFISPSVCGLLVWFAAPPSFAQLKPEHVQRAKKATALVEVTNTKERASGSAFCVDVTGLFVTNAHVVEMPGVEQPKVRLVLEIGTKAQRSVEAKLLRQDDRVDLALLKVDGESGLVPLDLGKDSDLKELSRIATFGYPFGRATAVGRAEYPDVTVLPSRITSLRKTDGRLTTIQFDNQINPGNSGGPVLNADGKIAGVAVATVRGAALNMAIPVGRLAVFLKAPGVVFHSPKVNYETRAQPVSMTVQLQPPTPEATLPQDLSVTITVPNEAGERSVYMTRPLGNGAYEAKVRPAARAPRRKVELGIKNGVTEQTVEIRMNDNDVSLSPTRFMTTVVRLVSGDRSGGERSVPDQPKASEAASTKPKTTAKPKTAAKPKTTIRQAVTLDLSKANTVRATPLNWPIFQAVEAVIDAKQGSEIVATIHERIALTGAPTGGVPRGGTDVTVFLPRPIPSGGPDAPNDEGRVKLGAALDVTGTPVGSGRSIRPPTVKIGAARVGKATEGEGDGPLVKRLDNALSDVAVGGGGRYLVLLFKDARKLAVFDVNTAEVVKTISLAATNALIAAGATKLLIVYPDEKLVQRWNLETLERDGGSRALPLGGRLTALALGSDSSGPALAYWTVEQPQYGFAKRGFSLIDIDSLKVLKAGIIASAGSRCSLSPSGGTFMLDANSNNPGLQDVPLHIRAAAGGALFAAWDTTQIPPGFLTIAARHKALYAIYRTDLSGYLAPGPDGRSVYTGAVGRVDYDGGPIDQAIKPGSGVPPNRTIPSADPAYYLKIDGLNSYDPWSASETKEVTASVHSASDGTRLFVVNGLDEMALPAAPNRNPEGFFIKHDLSVDKRLHWVPAANLLITIPFANDRLVLRRLDLNEALDRSGDDYLVVVSPPCVAASAGQKLDHQIVARSRKGGITYQLNDGPAGLEVASDGKVTWVVPDGQRAADLTARVAVVDAAGQRRIHNLHINVN